MSLIRCYDLHGVVRMRITRPRRLPFGRHIDRVYEAYEKDSVEDPNLDVIVGKFIPDLARTVRVGNCRVKQGYIYSEFSYKGAKWKVQIMGLESDRLDVRVDLNLLGPIGFASTTLINLVKLMFGQRGYASIHGACFGRGERALLFPARSGVGKTLLSLHMLKSGYHLLGDDKVFVGEGVVLSHLLPINLKFTYQTLPDIRISPSQRFSIVAKRFLSRATRGYFKLLTPASLKTLFPGRTSERCALSAIVHLISGPSFEDLGSIEMDAFIRQMIINSRVEAAELSRILDCYGHVFPEASASRYWETQAAVLTTCFTGVRRKRYSIPRTFTHEVARTLEVEFDGHGD